MMMSKSTRWLWMTVLLATCFVGSVVLLSKLYGGQNLASWGSFLLSGATGGAALGSLLKFLAERGRNR